MEKSTQDKKIDLMLDFTASLESQMRPHQNADGSFSFNPIPHFYICTADSFPGITTGYGTFIPLDKKENVTPEGKKILEILEVKNKETGLFLSQDEKESLVIQLYKEGKGKNLTENGFSEYGSFKNYEVTTQSAQKAFRFEFQKKNEKIRELTKENASFIVETVGTDMNYQGVLGNRAQKKREMLKKDRLSENIFSGRDKMRLKTRKLMATIDNTIKNNPFPDTISDEQKQVQGDILILKSIATSTQKLEANIKNNEPGVVERVEISSQIAAVQIAEEVKQRDLTPQEFDVVTKQVGFIVRENMMKGEPHEILQRAKNINKETKNLNVSSSKKTPPKIPSSEQPVLKLMTDNPLAVPPIKLIEQPHEMSKLIQKLTLHGFCLSPQEQSATIPPLKKKSHE